MARTRTPRLAAQRSRAAHAATPPLLDFGVINKMYKQKKEKGLLASSFFPEPRCDHQHAPSSVDDTTQNKQRPARQPTSGRYTDSTSTGHQDRQAAHIPLGPGDPGAAWPSRRPAWPPQHDPVMSKDRRSCACARVAKRRQAAKQPPATSTTSHQRHQPPASCQLPGDPGRPR